MRSLGVLEAALKKGATLHAFRSGGGLRVVRVERDGKLLGYGEHPSIRDALVHAAEDFAAGGRPYDEVYGDGKLHDHYLTGSSNPDGDLDAWILRGQTIDARAEEGVFVVELRGLDEVTVPKNVHEQAKAGATVQWSARGFRYETSPSRFPNGDMGSTTRIVEWPPHREHLAWLYDVKKTGRAATLQEAFDAALAAEPEEIAS